MNPITHQTLWVVWLSFFLGSMAIAGNGEIGLPNGIKLPLEGGVEGKLYALDPQFGRAYPVAGAVAESDIRLYLQYFPNLRRWHWVTVDDRTPIVAPSKVQGVRIGYPNGPYALDWFRLQPGDLRFVRTTDRVRPEITRRELGGREYVAERATDDWMTWGGTVDPASPAPPPKCELTASPAKSKVGQNVVLRLVASGNVRSAKIYDSIVGLPEGFLIVAPARAGKYLAKGEVEGPGGRGLCQTEIIVEEAGTPPLPPDPPKKPAPTCVLYATPSKVALGATVRLEVIVSGEATSAAIDGKRVELPRGAIEIVTSRSGEILAAASVEGPGGTGTCRASYVVDGATAPPTEPGGASCKITLSPSRVRVGESSIATMAVEGEWLEATLDGVILTGAEGVRRIAGLSAGNRKVEGRVKHEKGEATCFATLEVAP